MLLLYFAHFLRIIIRGNSGIPRISSNIPQKSGNIRVDHIEFFQGFVPENPQFFFVICPHLVPEVLLEVDLIPVPEI